MAARDPILSGSPEVIRTVSGLVVTSMLYPANETHVIIAIVRGVMESCDCTVLLRLTSREHN